MIRIIDGKGTGKTRNLMTVAKDSDAIIVCSNPNAMRRKAYDYGFAGIDFISYEDYFINHDDNCMYLIDELDNLLKYYNIIGYTISTGE